MINFNLINGKSSLTKLADWLFVERSNLHKMLNKFSKKDFRIDVNLLELGALCVANGVDKETLINLIKDLKADDNLKDTSV